MKGRLKDLRLSCLLEVTVAESAAVVVCVLVMDASIVSSSRLRLVQDSRVRVSLFKRRRGQSLSAFFYSKPAWCVRVQLLSNTQVQTVCV